MLKSLKPLHLLLLALPLAILAELLHWNPTLIFTLSALGVIPLAGLLGDATEALAAYTGPRLGGLINATLGNAAELIITIFAIRAGLLELVKASITGSILGNMLLVMGLSLLLGGLRHGSQHFDRRQAGLNASLLMLSIVALAIPSLFMLTVSDPIEFDARHASEGVALVMIIIYVLSLVYAFSQETPGKVVPIRPVTYAEDHLSVRQALTLLLAATLGIALLSELLVGSVEATVASLGISEFFIGIIIVPLVGNVAEHAVAVQAALKDKMELSLAVSLGSSIQIALFVAPILVFISILFGHSLNLVFNPFELASLLAAVIVTALIAVDGESNWLEGAMLLAVYLIIGTGFFFLP